MITKEKNNEVIVQFLDEHNISTIYQKRKIMCGEQNIFIFKKKRNLIYFGEDDITHSRLGNRKLCRQQIVTC